MAFVLGSATPAARDNPPEDDHLSSALHAALQGLTTASAPISRVPSDPDMSKGPRLDIILDQECLFLKGTGVDVEPARLAGHVALHLTESTSIKEITLQFRGKAKLPVPVHDSIARNASPLTYIVCSHEWSFLEGEKRHSHTLKAGRHFFPFQLQLGGSLPSSIATTAFGGASVQYKLRAHVVRPGLSHNMQAVVPVSIVRSFTAEALEYQQTLEIENTWPEKLMYSIMIPHKAWAAGDRLTALVKFCSLAKGARVLKVTTTINETTKVYARTGAQESTRTVATAKHEIVGGHAVEANEADAIRTPSSRHSPPLSRNSSTIFEAHYRSPFQPGSFSETPHHHRSPLSSSSSSTFPQMTSDEPHASPSTSSPAEAGTSAPAEDYLGDAGDGDDQNEVVTQITLPIPLSVTPSHALEPIIVSHRIRWSILIANLDGHTSELRCSLPLHVLDYRLLDEALSNTAATRRLLLGGPEPSAEEQDETELPSYTAHVRDRVANMFLPEAATIRVTNPWVHNNVSPVIVNGQATSPWSRSGSNTPLEAHTLSHLPHAPPSGTSTPLDWVNSELLLSLSQAAPPPLNLSRRTTRTPPEPPADTPPTSNPTSTPASPPLSRTPSAPSSRRGSRRGSRAPSPERSVAGVPVSALPVGGAHETYVHSGTTASRNMHGLFAASMKPFTALHSPGWLSARAAHPPPPTAADQEHTRATAAAARGGPPPPRDPTTGPALLHRAFTEVPDYGVAARGFIGGVPPLESMRGLPSYEEAERTHSDSDLVGRFQRAGARVASLDA